MAGVAQTPGTLLHLKADQQLTRDWWKLHPVLWRPQRPIARIAITANHKTHLLSRPTQSSTSSSDQHSHEEPRNRNYYGKNNQNNFTTRTWENNYTHRTCNSCREKGHMQRNCTKTDLYCNFCCTRTHDTVACKSKPKASTPLESPSAGDYHPAPSPRAHNTSIPPEDPNKSVIPNHVTQPSPVSSYTEDIVKTWITRLDQNQAETREK